MLFSLIVTENRRLEVLCMNLVGRNFLYRGFLKLIISCNFMLNFKNDV